MTTEKYNKVRVELGEKEFDSSYFIIADSIEFKDDKAIIKDGDWQTFRPVEEIKSFQSIKVYGKGTTTEINNLLSAVFEFYRTRDLGVLNARVGHLDDPILEHLDSLINLMERSED